jgi:hypothetical protein
MCNAVRLRTASIFLAGVAVVCILSAAQTDKAAAQRSRIAFVAQGDDLGKGTKRASWEGVVVRSNKDKSTLTVRNRDSNVEKTVQYDSATKWTSQEHHSKKVNDIDASQVKDDDRVIVLGTWDKNGVLHATLISKRLTR